MGIASLTRPFRPPTSSYTVGPERSSSSADPGVGCRGRGSGRAASSGRRDNARIRRATQIAYRRSAALASPCRCLRPIDRRTILPASGRATSRAASPRTAIAGRNAERRFRAPRQQTRSGTSSARRVDPEVRFGQCRRELAGDAADGSDRARIAVHAEDLESVLEEINEIAPAAAPCVDDALARRDPAAKDLIESRCRSGRTRQRDQSLCRCSVGFEPSGADVCCGATPRSRQFPRPA